MSLKEELEHRSEPESAPPESIEREREVRDLSLSVLGVSLVLLAVLVAVAMGAMGLVLGGLETREQAGQPEPPPLAGDATPPQPRLETQPGEVRRRQEAAQEQILGSYSWLDREQGLVRIPVERAMDVLAERGLPVRDGGGAAGDGVGPDPARQQPGAPGGTMEEDGRRDGGGEGR